jgi:hypothetical protein
MKRRVLQDLGEEQDLSKLAASFPLDVPIKACHPER